MLLRRYTCTVTNTGSRVGDQVSRPTTLNRQGRGRACSVSVLLAWWFTSHLHRPPDGLAVCSRNETGNDQSAIRNAWSGAARVPPCRRRGARARFSAAPRAPSKPRRLHPRERPRARARPSPISSLRARFTRTQIEWCRYHPAVFYGAATKGAPSLGPCGALTLPCGWNRTGPARAKPRDL